MKQGVAIKKKSEDSAKRDISNRFIAMIDLAIERGIIKNHREFVQLIDEPQGEFSKLKDPEYNRYVSVEMLQKATTIVGFNANYVLAQDGDKTEPLMRKDVQINGGNVSGNNNVVLTGQAVSQNGDVYLNVEKLTQSLPSKDRKEILKKFTALESQNTKLNADIEDLKKTIDRYEREIEKDKKIIQTQEKLIQFMEKAKPGKK